jgi:L-amino acid N-acyltransferase YncA
MNNIRKVNLIDINSTNVEQNGFFCRMSKMKTEGNRRKLVWLKERFSEGLKIKILQLPDRGFIEYIPGEYAWRSIEAKGYMFIHCIWVVGKSKDNGFGDLLLNECIRDAEKQNMKGVAALVSDDNWMANKNLFLKNGFEVFESAKPSFQLVVKKIKKAPNPKLINNWNDNLAKYKNGLTVLLTDQCPYLDDATQTIRKYAEENKIPFNVIEFKSAKEVREKSVSPYGTFNIIYNGKLLSYYYLLPKDIGKRIQLT